MYTHIKRLFDIIFSILLLVILMPIFLLIAIIIRMTMGSPVFFRQLRIGENNVPFSIIKFRTMDSKTSNNLSEKKRLTRIGVLLRITSLDEIPQLINILKGEMSFIGPRPLLLDYLPYYNDREIIRHKIKPGMTSLAGVTGRNFVTWEDQFEMDVYYVENLSFWLDIKIFIKTIPKVLGSKDLMVIGRIDQDKFDVHRQKQMNLRIIDSSEC